MKIDPSLSGTPLVSSTRPQARPAADPAAAPRQAEEQIQFSTVLKQLQSENQAPVNKVRVQEIKQAISEGRFTINSSTIADSLIETARQYAGQRRG